jgi:hypothetical protein
MRISRRSRRCTPITSTNTKLDTLHTDLATTLAGLVDGLEGILGTTSGAAVITDANGTVQQYLRGLVKRWVDALGTGTAAAALRTTLATDVGLPAGTSLLGKVKTKFIVAAGAALTRPANTTAYTANDAISDNATIGSVTAKTISLSDVNDDTVTIERLRLATTDTGLQGKSVRAFLYSSDPTANSGVQGGDNAAFSNKLAGFIGSMSGTFRTFQDGAVAVLVPDEGSRIISRPALARKPSGGSCRRSTPSRRPPTRPPSRRPPKASREPPDDRRALSARAWAGGCRRGRRRRRRHRWRLRRRSHRHHHGLRQHHGQGPGQAGLVRQVRLSAGDDRRRPAIHLPLHAAVSQLAQQGKLAMVGFGLKNNNDFHIVGLRGDGSTGLHKYKVNGTPPNGWNKDTGHTTSDGGARPMAARRAELYPPRRLGRWRHLQVPDQPRWCDLDRRIHRPDADAVLQRLRRPPSASRCGSTMPMPGRSRSSSTSSPMRRRRRVNGDLTQKRWRLGKCEQRLPRRSTARSSKRSIWTSSTTPDAHGASSCCHRRLHDATSARSRDEKGPVATNAVPSPDDTERYNEAARLGLQ